MAKTEFKYNRCKLCGYRSHQRHSQEIRQHIHDKHGVPHALIKARKHYRRSTGKITSKRNKKIKPTTSKPRKKTSPKLRVQEVIVPIYVRIPVVLGDVEIIQPANEGT